MGWIFSSRCLSVRVSLHLFDIIEFWKVFEILIQLHINKNKKIEKNEERMKINKSDIITIDTNYFVINSFEQWEEIYWCMVMKQADIKAKQMERINDCNCHYCSGFQMRCIISRQSCFRAWFRCQHQSNVTCPVEVRDGNYICHTIIVLRHL